MALNPDRIRALAEAPDDDVPEMTGEQVDVIAQIIVDAEQQAAKVKRRTA